MEYTSARLTARRCPVEIPLNLLRDSARIRASSKPESAVRIGFVQTSPKSGDVKGNCERAKSLIGDGCGANLLVLPELFNTGYLRESRSEAAALAEDAGGPTIAWAKALSQRIGTSICAGFILRDAGGCYNASFLVSAGELIGLYAKTHLFDREKLVFDPGPGPFTVQEIDGTKVGMMICFDWQFPEAARSMALDGAQILLHPSNLVLPFAQEAMRTRCLENGVFAVTANRIGTEKDLTFTGQSQITGPKGELLARATASDEAIQVVEIDPNLAMDKMITERNDRFADRRPELYGRVASLKS
jgi:predicted amidohydrolase